MVTRLFPQDARYVTDYAACLPLAETLGRSAEFAVDHDGDHGPQAMREWLDVIGLEWGVESDGLAEWSVNRRWTTTVTAPFVVTLPVDSPATWSNYETWQTLTGARTNRYAGGSDARRARLRDAARRDLRNAMPHAYREVQLDSTSWSVDGRTLTGTLVVSAEQSGSDTVRASSESDALARVGTSNDCEHCPSHVVDRVRVTNAMRAFVTVNVPAGWTVRVGQGAIGTSNYNYAYEVESDDVIQSIADAFDNGGAAAVASGFGITVSEAIVTDEWLAMIRDTAVQYEWCSEHHALITRVTHTTREPFGWAPTGSIEASIDWNEGEPITSWHGRSESGLPDSYDISRLIERALSDEYGVSVNVSVDGSMDQESYEPPARRSIRWASSGTSGVTA